MIPVWLSFRNSFIPESTSSSGDSFFAQRWARNCWNEWLLMQGTLGKRKMRGQNLVEKERLGARQFQSEVPIVLTLESNDPAWRAWYPRQTINMTCAFQCRKFVFSYHDTKKGLEWKTEWLVRARNVVSIIVLVSRGPQSFWTASLSRPLREQSEPFQAAKRPSDVPRHIKSDEGLF